MDSLGGNRSVLQRRSSISNSLQALLDGVAGLGPTYAPIGYYVGRLN